MTEANVYFKNKTPMVSKGASVFYNSGINIERKADGIYIGGIVASTDRPHKASWIALPLNQPDVLKEIAQVLWNLAK
jgi:hypothetical protein